MHFLAINKLQEIHNPQFVDLPQQGTRHAGLLKVEVVCTSSPVSELRLSSARTSLQSSPVRLPSKHRRSIKRNVNTPSKSSQCHKTQGFMAAKSVPECLVLLSHNQHEACQLVTTHQWVQVHVKSCLVAVFSIHTSWQSSWNSSRHFCPCNCSELEVVEYPQYRCMLWLAMLSCHWLSRVKRWPKWDREGCSYKSIKLYFGLRLLSFPPMAGKHFRERKLLFQSPLLSFSYCATVLKLPWLSVMVFNSPRKGVGDSLGTFKLKSNFMSCF